MTESDDARGSGHRGDQSSKSFGVLIREAREAAGYSIERAAMSTRITPAFIEALEQQNFELLPGAIFGRGFIRNLCRTYGCDSAKMIAAYEQASNFKADSVQDYRENKKHAKPKRILSQGQGEWKDRLKSNVNDYYRRGRPIVVLVPIVALMIVFTKYLYQEFSPNPAEPKKPIATSSEPSAISTPEAASSLANSNPIGLPSDQKLNPTPSSPSAEVKPVAETTPAVFSGEIRGEGVESLELIVKEAVNVKINRDRDKALTETLAPKSYKFQFNEQLKIFIDNMAAVELRFKGQVIPNRGIKGEQRLLTFAVSEGALAKKNEKTKL